MKNIRYIIGVFLFAMACSSKVAPIAGPAKTAPPLTDSVIAKSARWRLDSAGCLHYRSLRLANNIVAELPESYKNFDSLLVLLGPPDARVENAHFLSLTYLDHSICYTIEGDTPDIQGVSFEFDPVTRKLLRIGAGST